MLRRIALWSAGLLGGLAVLIAIVVADRIGAMRASLPVLSGSADVPGLGAEVRILRDEFGVPHIRAATFEDALSALGYVHVQDRLFQMEFVRRLIRGELSGMAGPLALPVDRAMRILGLGRAADASWDHLLPETRRALEAYARGVNAGLRDMQGWGALELALLFHRPEPWTPQDSLVALKAMALQLSGNAFMEGARARLAPVLGREKLQQFFPPYPGDPVLPLPPHLSLFLSEETAARHAPDWPTFGASNNWAIGGRLTRSGFPLLANDPHLGLNAPSIWYVAHLRWGDEGDWAFGGTLAGVPGIITGRTGRFAWGITTTGGDVQDVYLEQLDPEDPGRYRTPEGWAAFEARAETIPVRFGSDETITIRESRHGPVLDIDDPRFRGALPEAHVAALAFTALDPDDTTMDVAIGAHHLSTGAEFRALAARYVAPMQTITYADTQGGFGLIAPARVPVRRTDNDGHGMVPAPGWDARYDWTGYLAARALPQESEPARGWVASANDKITPPGYPHFITADWTEPYRGERIAALIDAKAPHDASTMAAMLTDPVCGYAPHLLPLLLAVPAADARAASAITMLRAWDLAMLRDRPEPLIYTAWHRALARALWADELGDLFQSTFSQKADFILDVLRDTRGAAQWCDDVATDTAETCAERVALALDTALDELEAAHGPDMARWRWGDVHVAVQTNPVLGRVPGLAGLFGIESELDGGGFTLLRADYRFSSATPYRAVHGAGYRGFYDLAPGGTGAWIISTGQSANPFSPHYRDLAPIWAEGGFLPIRTDPAAIEAAAVHILTLQPSTGAAATP